MKIFIYVYKYGAALSSAATYIRLESSVPEKYRPGLMVLYTQIRRILRFISTNGHAVCTPHTQLWKIRKLLRTVRRLGLCEVYVEFFITDRSPKTIKDFFGTCELNRWTSRQVYRLIAFFWTKRGRLLWFFSLTSSYQWYVCSRMRR